MAAKAPRMPRVAASVLAGIAKHMEKGLAYEDQEAISQVNEFLKEHPEQAKAVLRALKTGYFKAKGDEEDMFMIPKTRTHLNLISTRFIKQCLQTMCPALSPALLVNVSKADSSLLIKMFCFATSEQPHAPTFTHNGKDFIEHYIKVYNMLGKRLERLSITNEGVDFSKGMFEVLEVAGDGDTQHVIQHISGVQVWPSFN